jgi:hypothetical protein
VTGENLFLILQRINVITSKMELYLHHFYKLKLEMEEKNEVKKGRNKKEIAEGRVKFTTSLQESLIKWVKIYAVETKQTPADILETALNLYKYEKERNK